MSDLLSQLILTDLQIANLDVGAIIAIDTPTVLLNTIDAVGIAADIIDVHHTDTVVGVDSDVVHIVGRTGKHVAINTGNEALTLYALLLKVYLSVVLILWIDNHGVILLGVRATNHRDTKLIPFVGSGDGEADLVVTAQAAQ